MYSQLAWFYTNKRIFTEHHSAGSGSSRDWSVTARSQAWGSIESTWLCMQCSGTFAPIILCTCLSGSFEWDECSNQSTEKSRTPSIMQDFIHSSRDLGRLKKSHRREFSLWLFQVGHRYLPALGLELKHWLHIYIIYVILIFIFVYNV